MSLVIGSNIASLRAQRSLAASSAELKTSYERLSSGLRINRASDDAAGLSISTKLDLDSRVFTQAIRNINDGISLLNIAQGALGELSNVSIRQRELATQAANGAYSITQRRALNTEANALVDEFNRIVQSISFNGRRIIDSNLEQLWVQAGYGTSGGILFNLAQKLARNVGDGSVGFAQDNTTAVSDDVATADINNDGFADLIGVGGNQISIRLGNGDGTFKVEAAYSTGGGFGYSEVYAGDFNNDGSVDVVVGGGFNNGVAILLGNGNGSFKAVTAYSGTALLQNDIRTEDVNGDGFLDIITSEDSAVNVWLGNGNGTFKINSKYSNNSATGQTINVFDFNGDGVHDLLTNGNAGAVVFIGNGDGTFRRISTPAISNSVTTMAIGDFNFDGYDDFATNGGTADTNIFLGNGNGTFKAGMGINVGYNPDTIETADMNGDGISDLVITASSDIGIFLGNRDGTFKSGNITASVGAIQTATADFNRDGAIDVLASGSFYIHYGHAETVTTSSLLNINTRAGALKAIPVIDATLSRIAGELGAIGAAQSRYSSALNSLEGSRENFRSAYNRIADADIAAESATLVRNKILQDAASSILAQANQAPALALTLLESG